VVETDSTLRDPVVVRGLGLGLDESALEAVRHGRFASGYFNGRDVPTEVVAGVDFVLAERSSRWHFIG
jgi:hypothetical protein